MGAFVISPEVRDRISVILEKIKDEAIALCRKRYVEFGPTHAGEKLLACHQIEVSTEDRCELVQPGGCVVSEAEEASSPAMAAEKRVPW